MLIQNVLYSTIDLYIKKINQYLSDGYIISADCKTYDKSKDDIVIFKCFDIKSHVRTDVDFLISEMNYSGYLEFTYNKATNEVYISKLPYYMDGEVEIPIFTSDIAQLIVNILKKSIPNEDIKLTFFSPVLVFALDNNVKNVIPSVMNTKNFNIINHIIDKIALEEKKIRQHVLSLKAKKEREDKAIERAVSKKRIIYGIDPNNFENQQEFYTVIDQKICEVYSRKIEKIRRHLHLNEHKYKEMLKNGLSKNGHADSFIYNMDFRQWAQKNGISKSLFLALEDEYIEEITKEREYAINKYIEYRYHHDLHDSRGILSLIDFVKKEVIPLPEFRNDSTSGIDNNTLYLEIVRQLASINNTEDSNGCCNDKFDFTGSHPIFGSDNYSCNKRNFGEWPYYIEYTYTFSHDIGLATELLLQIRSLTKQLEYYLSVINEPSKALLTFKKDNNSWNSIMQHPYFVRMGRDSFRGGRHELFNLLMIKPGTMSFEDKNIRYFIQKGDKEKDVNSCCDRMVVAIPDSLQQDSLLRVVQYAHDKSNDLNFICQSPDLASRVKSILVNSELQARINNNKYIRGNYFINIDPNYYNTFFVDTPDNKEFWHKYDYSSDYKYRRKIIYDLNTIIDMCIQEYLERNAGSKEIHYDILSEMILGSYSGDDTTFNLNDFLFDKQGVDGRTLDDDCDKVLAFMQILPNIWKRELPLIDAFKYDIDRYLNYSNDKFQEQKEQMLLFKELFQENWQNMWTRMYLSTQICRTLLDVSNIKTKKEELLIFKEIFPDDWENVWIEINKEMDLYRALIDSYRKNPQVIKKKLLSLKKSNNWKKDMRLLLLDTAHYDDDFLPF